MNKTSMTVGARLVLGFGLVLALLALTVGIGMNRMAAIQERLEHITQVNNTQLELATGMRATVFDRTVSLQYLALLSDVGQMQAEVARIKEQSERYRTFEEKLGKMFSEQDDVTAEEKALLTKIKEAGRVASPLIAKVEELGLANKTEEAAASLMKEFRPAQQNWVATLSELVAVENKLNDEAEAEAASAYATARVLMLSLAAFALAIGAAASVMITRGLQKQLGGEPDYASAVASRIASGDLTSEVAIRPGDHTSMLYAMKAMRDSLVNIVSQVRTGTETITTASGQIAAGNLDLSSRTEEQAGSLEETASSMEELTSTVKQNADNARQANSLALSASEVAQRGGGVVSQVVETMGSINESAKKIVDIIGVIDGIAFQTNILALNAAVEAARAGEQGRGFAVVASEVRNLAQRSAAAAKEIKALISDSVEKVDVGAKLVDQAGSTMEEIVESVKRVTDIMGEITAATQEQTSGIEQINLAISQMDQVTQQNASLVEQATAASESMQEQANHLAQVVSVFQLGSVHATALAHSSPAVRKTAMPEKKPAIRRQKKERAAIPGAAPLRRPAPVHPVAGGEWEEF